ncbi:MAG: hypothetical protein ABI488_25390 [Polyangiaceae bacterium]
MNTTIDISYSLLERAKRPASKAAYDARERVEAGLHREFAERRA